MLVVIKSGAPAEGELSNICMPDMCVDDLDGAATDKQFVGQKSAMKIGWNIETCEMFERFLQPTR
jgi:hypothetical protein